MDDPTKKKLRNLIELQRRGDIDTFIKHSYLGDGAERYLGLINTLRYGSYHREMALLDEIAPEIGDISRVVDLGVGDGTRSARILSKLKCSYLGLDISKQMLNYARAHHCMALPGLKAEYKKRDFSNILDLVKPLGLGNKKVRSEEANEWDELEDPRDKNPQLYLFLGNTLANETDVGFYLMLFGMEIMQPVDRLMVGFDLCPTNIDQMLSEYQTPESQAFAFGPLRALGLDPSEGQYEVDFNQGRKRVEEWFVVDEDRLLLSVTYKPTLDQARKLVQSCEFVEEKLAVDKDELNAVMLLSKKPKEKRKKSDLF